MRKTVTRREAVRFIRNTKGLFFGAIFRKRTTGEIRRMRARTGVKKHLKGGPPAYNFSEKALISVWDIEKMGYRSIPIEGLIKVKINGRWFLVEGGEKLIAEARKKEKIDGANE